MNKMNRVVLILARHSSTKIQCSYDTLNRRSLGKSEATPYLFDNSG